MTEHEQKQIEEKALKLFGETDDIKKAGWILPSGKMVLWEDSHEWMARNINDCTANDLIQQGWIRTLFAQPGIEIRAYGAPTVSQLRKVYDLIVQTDQGDESGYFLIEWTDKDDRHITKKFEADDPEEIIYCMGIMHQVGFDEVYQEEQKRKEKRETK